MFISLPVPPTRPLSVQTIDLSLSPSLSVLELSPFTLSPLFSVLRYVQLRLPCSPFSATLSFYLAILAARSSIHSSRWIPVDLVYLKIPLLRIPKIDLADFYSQREARGIERDIWIV